MPTRSSNSAVGPLRSKSTIQCVYSLGVSVHNHFIRWPLAKDIVRMCVIMTPKMSNYAWEEMEAHGRLWCHDFCAKTVLHRDTPLLTGAEREFFTQFQFTLFSFSRYNFRSKSQPKLALPSDRYSQRLPFRCWFPRIRPNNDLMEFCMLVVALAFVILVRTYSPLASCPFLFFLFFLSITSPLSICWNIFLSLDNPLQICRLPLFRHIYDIPPSTYETSLSVNFLRHLERLLDKNGEMVW